MSTSQKDSNPIIKPEEQPKSQTEPNSVKEEAKPSKDSKESKKPKSKSAVSKDSKNKKKPFNQIRRRRNLMSSRRRTRNRRIFTGFNKKRRLFRAQRAANKNGKKFYYKKNYYHSYKRLGFKPIRRYLRLRKLFVSRIPRSVDDRKFFNLFRYEGRLLSAKIIYDKLGYSKGFGILEFANPRDAWKVIKKCNDNYFRGFRLKVQYKKKWIKKGWRKFNRGGSRGNSKRFQKNGNFGGMGGNNGGTQIMQNMRGRKGSFNSRQINGRKWNRGNRNNQAMRGGIRKQIDSVKEKN